MSRQFIDRLRLFVKAGSGAAGNPAIRGKGGDGGSIFLEVSNNFTLDKLLETQPTKRFKATHGLEASKRRGEVIGQNGRDVVIPVPPGISVYRAGPQVSANQMSSPSTPVKLGDLDTVGQRLLVAQGGLGGVAQTGFLGSPGQTHSVILDLKLMADYSLIGFPNAGKSSLLRAVSNAKVKIASYPFTTVRPQVACCTYGDARSISLADLPGLDDIYADYSDRHVNAGSSEPPQLPAMRHTNFLKHVERSACILLCLDANGFQRNQNSVWRSPLTSAYMMLHLLERWSGGFLLDKPFVCVLNKIDLPDAEEAAKRSTDWLQRWHSPEAQQESGLPQHLLPSYLPQLEGIHQISASELINISELKTSLRTHLDRIELRKRANVDANLQMAKVDAIEKEDALLFDRKTLLC